MPRSFPPCPVPAKKAEVKPKVVDIAKEQILDLEPPRARRPSRDEAEDLGISSLLVQRARMSSASSHGSEPSPSKTLMDHSVNKRNFNGETGLHIAAKEGL